MLHKTKVTINLQSVLSAFDATVEAEISKTLAAWPDEKKQETKRIAEQIKTIGIYLVENAPYVFDSPVNLREEREVLQNFQSFLDFWNEYFLDLGNGRLTQENFEEKLLVPFQYDGRIEEKKAQADEFISALKAMRKLVAQGYDEEFVFHEGARVEAVVSTYARLFLANTAQYIEQINILTEANTFNYSQISQIDGLKVEKIENIDAVVDLLDNSQKNAFVR